MLDKKSQMMLELAAELTAEDLDCLRGLSSVPGIEQGASDDGEACEPEAVDATDAEAPDLPDGEAVGTGPFIQGDPARGEYERRRTRESKVSTACLGHEREKHDWWPVGTDLVGRMGSETFTAMLVENAGVKSGRSILITSGPASGKVCITPTRAAIEATEHYRQSHNLGRGGGVTNGWTFWKPRQ